MMLRVLNVAAGMASAQLTLTLYAHAKIDPGKSNAKEWQLSHLHMQAHHPFTDSWSILSKLEQSWATSINFEQFCLASLEFKQFWSFVWSSSGNLEQAWTNFWNAIWYCQPWTLFKMYLLRLLLDTLLWLKQVAVNFKDLDPKTRSVKYVILKYIKDG